MKQMGKAVLWGGMVIFMLQGTVLGQEAKLKAAIFEGVLVGGYTDHGAYLNCTGPAIKYQAKSFSVMLGLLPTLKFKKERTVGDAPKNSVMTPTLGFGLTAIFRHFAIQLPAFYSPKTSVDNGKWRPGIGVGYRF